MTVLPYLVDVKILATNVTEPTKYPIARDAFGWDVTPRRCRQFDACGCYRSGWPIPPSHQCKGSERFDWPARITASSRPLSGMLSEESKAHEMTLQAPVGLLQQFFGFIGCLQTKLNE